MAEWKYDLIAHRKQQSALESSKRPLCLLHSWLQLEKSVATRDTRLLLVAGDSKDSVPMNNVDVRVLHKSVISPLCATTKHSSCRARSNVRGKVPNEFNSS